MIIKSFLGVVEIRTKVASIIPFLLGTLYEIYHFHDFNIGNFIIFFCALICVDMVTTALNNYYDFKRANKREGYNYEKHNAIVRDNLKESTVLAMILFLFTAAVSLGILLAFRTNIIVLLLGALSMAIGICYSFGPVPISRTPFGEMFSGFFMGFVILFLSIYIHIYNSQLAVLKISSGSIDFHVILNEMLYILLLSVPCMCGIANIMLANNICDVPDDLENRRFTLPVFIGINNSLHLFRWLYYFSFIAIIALVILRIIPALCIIAVFTFILVYKNIGVFYLKQTKKETFPLSVKNFLMIAVTLIILFGLSLLLNAFI